MNNKYDNLITNIKTISTIELRTLNRYYLHKNNKRCCTECRIIFEGIRENFHIKKYQENGKISWNVKCRECFNKTNRERVIKYRNDYKLFIKHKVSSYKSRANQENAPFDLDAEHLIELFEKQDSKCFYTNQEILFTNTVVAANRPDNMTPSLDRLIPELGYTKGNVVWSAYYINRMKNDIPYKEFIELCKIITKKDKERQQTVKTALTFKQTTEVLWFLLA